MDMLLVVVVGMRMIRVSVHGLQVYKDMLI